MTETYSHKFQSGRVCTVCVRYRRGRIPVLRCSNPDGDFTPEELPEYVAWRRHVAARTLANLDPVAIAKLALSPDDDDPLHDDDRENTEEIRMT